MANPRLLWRLYGTYLVVILFCTLALGIAAVSWIESFYYPSKQRELEQKAHLIERRIRDVVTPLGDTAQAINKKSLLAPLRRAVDPACDRVAPVAGVRVTVVLRSGNVIGDSEEDPAQMRDHSDRPEIRDALQTGHGVSRRPSPTLGIEMMYVAIPLDLDGERFGVLRLSLPLTDLAEAIGAVTWKVIVGAIAVTIVASLLSLWISRWISRPLEEMRRGADRFARGDFTEKLVVSGAAGEMAGLAESLNSMAEQLDRRIRTIMQQRQELAAVLSSMSEGVLAVDGSERVISINDAAARMFNVPDPGGVKGRALAEVIRNPVLQELVGRVWSSKHDTSEEISVDAADGEHQVEVNGSIIHGPGEKEIGVLTMLRDVTRLRQLERLRRDFVANVSHELKTPVTSIQGFVETLREGAAEDPAKGKRFLDIIANQADRLGAIIDDLLSLSRIEQEARKGPIDTVETSVTGVIRSAAESRQSRADERNVTLDTLGCPNNLPARINPRLLEQAISNLLDNAIKYSEPGGTVWVEARPEGDEVRTTVRDRGCGIPAEDLPRIFERFYRVDKARSRDLGGTGLGLAIVKHIAQAHGGRVTVESTVGRGSAFTLHLPTTPQTPLTHV